MIANHEKNGDQDCDIGFQSKFASLISSNGSLISYVNEITWQIPTNGFYYWKP